MIALHDFSLEIEDLKTLITQRIEHTYLNKYIERPIIDEEKLTILSIIVNNTTLSEATKKQYIVTTMLVQIALDTHDLVPITHNETESETGITSRQLTVLAGDYFSGLYYLLLAEIEDINMINILASAIKEINEYKMKLYYKEVDSFNEYISLIKKIESLLIIHVAKFVNNSIIDEMAGNLIITSKLIQEKRNLATHVSSPILDNWLAYSTSSTYPSILNEIELIIQTNTGQMKVFLSQPTLRISVFKKSLQYMLNKLIYNNTSIAEEG